MIREIVRPHKRQLKIDIPQQYVNKRLEVLVIPFYEIGSTDEYNNTSNDENLQRLFNNAPNIKIGKDIDIDALMNEVNDVVL